MTDITVAGIGSGLDVNGLVEQLVAAEAAPTTRRLDQQEAGFQATLSSYGTLKGALASFQGAVSSMTSMTSFRTKTASVADTDKFTATASSIATTGSYSVEVSQLAQANSLVGADTFSAVTDVVGTGALTFRFGTTVYDSGTDTYTSFTVNADKPAKTVTITDGSLQGIRDAVNTADIGVTANIIDDGSGFRLLFVSDDSGADSSLEIVVAENPVVGSNTDTSGLSKFAFSAAATNMDQTVAGQDAQIKVNGLAISRESNTVSGAIQGVILNLVAVTAGTPVQLTVTQDQAAVTTAVNNFVSSFNDLIATLDSLAGFDPGTGNAGVLIGDSTVRSIGNEIRRIFGDAVPGITGPFTSLADIGITTLALNAEQADGSILMAGSLVVDSDKLQQSLDTDADAVGRLFAATGTPSDSLVNFVSSTSNTQAGTYLIELDSGGQATQGNYTGSGGISSLTLNSGNKTFALSVDGAQSGTITLTEGTYNTDGALATLAAEIQGSINADSGLLAALASVTASYDTVNDQFLITSSSYGSTSVIAITATNATLGLATGTATDGNDVAGTIGGSIATGSGRFLNGHGNASGLQVEVTGSSDGSRGSIAFTRGYADRLNGYISSLLTDEGILNARTDGAQEGIDGIEEQRVDLAERLKVLESRLRSQFTALDTLLVQLRSTSDFLTQQLAVLNN
ncbi:MAG: flagellar filament capping protein FliD [Gammaproteobacteria bacterium]|nr:flagellar filament capping protein FliD [Gammaproteobacteria bacterium]